MVRWIAVMFSCAALAGCTPILTEEQKACVPAATRILQSVAPSSMKVVSAENKSNFEIARNIVESFSDPNSAKETLSNRFSLLDYSKYSAIESLYKRGDYYEANSKLTDILKEWLSGGAIIDISASVAGQQITYRFACGWDALGKLYAAPMGHL